jgi:cytoskeletal protein CcmA (bactofilin family)
VWRRSEDSKLKSPADVSSSPALSARHAGGVVPSHSFSAATVSQGIKIKGEISGQGDFSWDGVFEGKIHIPDGTFTVGPKARVSAEIEAREIIIRGEVIGTLMAHERIQIWNTAKVTGNMETRGIKIEDGAVLHSKVAVPQTVAQAAVPEEDQASQLPRPEIPLRR